MHSSLTEHTYFHLSFGARATQVIDMLLEKLPEIVAAEDEDPAGGAPGSFSQVYKSFISLVHVSVCFFLFKNLDKNCTPVRT